MSDDGILIVDVLAVLVAKIQDNLKQVVAFRLIFVPSIDHLLHNFTEFSVNFF
jgi:hypothetical protein